MTDTCVQVNLYKHTFLNIWMVGQWLYNIATVHSPSWQYAVHGSAMGNNEVTDTHVHVYTHTS